MISAYRKILADIIDETNIRKIGYKLHNTVPMEVKVTMCHSMALNEF